MAQTAAASIRELIVMGTIPQGEPLRLEELARRLDMSISPVREAIRQLEMVGLAEHIPYRGTRVTYLSINELHIVHDARVGLESLAVRHTAERFDAQLDERLTSCVDELDAAYRRGDRAGIVHGNTDFHQTIAQGSGSPWLATLISRTLEVWERYSAAVALIDRTEDTFAVESEGHREILSACRRHDAAGAEAALRDHLAVSKGIFERGARPSVAFSQGRDA